MFQGLVALGIRVKGKKSDKEGNQVKIKTVFVSVYKKMNK